MKAPLNLRGRGGSLPLSSEGVREEMDIQDSPTQLKVISGH
jgi:hypothetical protein